jgi:hypothetical protein
MSNNDNNIKEIKGQPFKDTFRLGVPSTLVYIQPPYHLNQIEFNIISKPSKLEIFSSTILIFAITLSIEMISKAIILFMMGQNNDIIASIFKPTDKFEKWKLVAIGLILIISLGLLICRLFPTQRRKLMNKIRTYYRDNPPLLRGVQDDK